MVSWRIGFFLGLFALFCLPVRAEPVKGLAIVEIETRRNVLELTQAVAIFADKAQFINIDELGTQSFAVEFQEKNLLFKSPYGERNVKSGLKRALSLPLKQSEFLGVLNYRLPEGFKSEKLGETEIWKSKKNKNLEILFQNFGTIEGRVYPKQISIQYKKNAFRIQWLSFKESSS